MKPISHGDLVYIDDPKLYEYGSRGTIINSRTIDVCPYNWYIEYTVRCSSGCISVNETQISINKPGSREGRLKRDRLASIAISRNHINQEIKRLEQDLANAKVRLKGLTS